MSRKLRVALVCSSLLAPVALGLSSAAVAQSPPGVRALPDASGPLAFDEGVRFTRSQYAAYSGHPGPDAAVRFATDGSPPPRPLRAVVFLHGWSGCVRVLALHGPVACVLSDSATKRFDRRLLLHRAGWGLADAHRRAGVASVLVIPQLAFQKRVTDPGAFKQAGVFRAFLDDVLRQSSRDESPEGRSWSLEYSDVDSMTLIAHSAGYAAALAILRQPELRDRVRHVVLLDALYAGTDEFAAWLCEAVDRRLLVSLYTGKSTTFRQNQALRRLASQCAPASDLRVELPSLQNANHQTNHQINHQIAQHNKHHAGLAVARTTIAHGEIPKRLLAELLLWLPE